MLYKFEYRPYKRKFVRPLQTSHGTWETREGIIIRLTDEDSNSSWGEIAPIPWFGSENIKQADDFCHQLSGKITQELIFSIPDKLPACQFGFESALGLGSREEFENTPKLQWFITTRKSRASRMEETLENGYS
ncbi:MAG: hypothetical protein HC908_15020, partial [Calothrix sp. SM1_7_51]|nr:hypothetical protein [Calothrix sp. SM1_7_51]